MDYLEYYQLSEHPFSNVVDGRFYYASPQQSEAIVKLKYAIDTKKGLAVVVGNIGAGKTTLARKLLEELDEENYEAALLVIIHSTVSSEWLFRKFAIQLGVKNAAENKIELLGEIYRRLNEINEEGKKAVVLMDEVQMLNSREIMEEFRGLLNMESPEGKMVNFVFFGLPELDRVLALDEPLKREGGGANTPSGVYRREYRSVRTPQAAGCGLHPRDFYRCRRKADLPLLKGQSPSHKYHLRQRPSGRVPFQGNCYR